MPIYEYKRPDGSTFEVLQGFTDPPLERDPETGVPVERVLHAPAVHFKGKGFYNTDYGTRKRQREKSASGDGSSSGEAASSGESSSSGEGSSVGKGASSNGASSSNGSGSEKGTSSGGQAKGSAPTAKSGSATSSAG